jgi:hypothetical protein
MRLVFAFNHTEALRFFKEAARLDQSMAAQGKDALAEEFLALYKEEWKDADVELTSSRIK